MINKSPKQNTHTHTKKNIIMIRIRTCFGHWIEQGISYPDWLDPQYLTRVLPWLTGPSISHSVAIRCICHLGFIVKRCTDFAFISHRMATQILKKTVGRSCLLESLIHGGYFCSLWVKIVECSLTFTRSPLLDQRLIHPGQNLFLLRCRKPLDKKCRCWGWDVSLGLSQSLWTCLHKTFD